MKKIAILGLGYSIGEFNPADFEFTIGVNDIWRIFKSDIVVCLNPPKDFRSDRLKFIKECKPQKFYSQMVVWDTRPDFEKIEILPGYGADIFLNLDLHGYYKSYCSPFVACQIAFKEYYATEIHLFGVDMINHPELNGGLCEKIRIHFKNLKTALKLKGCELVIHGEGILKDI